MKKVAVIGNMGVIEKPASDGQTIKTRIVSSEEYYKMQNACRVRALQLFSKASFLKSYNEILQ
jgi:hypothetical protein